MTSQTLMRAEDSLAAANRMIASIEYRSTPDQRNAHFQDIYSNYALLKAQADEFQDMKKVIDHDLFQSNRDRINELLFSTAEVDTTDWGDWDTWKKVEQVVKKFVYGQSANITTKPDILEAMKKNTAALSDVNNAQAERIRKVEGGMAELQSELSGLINLLQLKERKAQSLASKNRILILQIRQVQREVDELGGRRADEKELVKDFKLVINANKLLEKENMELRAKLNIKDGFLGTPIDESDVTVSEKDSTSVPRLLSLLNASQTSPVHDQLTEEQVDEIIRSDERRLSYLFHETPASAVWATLKRSGEAWMQRLEREVDNTMGMLDHDADEPNFLDDASRVRLGEYDDAFVLPSPGVFTLYRGYNKNQNALDDLKPHLPVSVSYAPQDNLPFASPAIPSGTLDSEITTSLASNRATTSSRYNSIGNARADPQTERSASKKRSKKKEGPVESSTVVSRPGTDVKASPEAPLKSKKSIRAHKEGEPKSVSPRNLALRSPSGTRTATSTEPMKVNRAWTSLSKGILAMAQLSRAECLKREYLHISRLRKKLHLEKKRRAALGMSVTDYSIPTPSFGLSNSLANPHVVLPHQVPNPKLAASLDSTVQAPEAVVKPSSITISNNPKKDEFPSYKEPIVPSEGGSFRRRAYQPSGMDPVCRLAPDTQPSSVLSLETQQMSSPISVRKVSFTSTVISSDTAFDQPPSSPTCKTITPSRCCSESRKTSIFSTGISTDSTFEQFPSNSASKPVTPRSTGKETKKVSFVSAGISTDIPFEQSLSNPASKPVTPRSSGKEMKKVSFASAGVSTNPPFKHILSSPTDKITTSCSSSIEAKNASFVSLETLSNTSFEQPLSSPASKSISSQSLWKMSYMGSPTSLSASTHQNIVAIGCSLKDKEYRPSQSKLSKEVVIQNQLTKETAQSYLHYLQGLRLNSRAIHNDLGSLMHSFSDLCSTTNEAFKALQLILGDIFRLVEFKNADATIANSDATAAFDTISKTALKDLAKERVFSILAEHGVKLEAKEGTKNMSDLDWMMQQIQLAVVNAAENYVAPTGELNANSLVYDSQGAPESISTTPPRMHQDASRATADLGHEEMTFHRQKKDIQPLLPFPSNGSSTPCNLEDAVSNSYFIKDILFPHETTRVPQWSDLFARGRDQRSVASQEYEAMPSMNGGAQWSHGRSSSRTLEEYRSAGLFLNGFSHFKDSVWRPVMHGRFENEKSFMSRKPPGGPPYGLVAHSSIDIIQLLRRFQSTKVQSIEQIRPTVYSYRLKTDGSTAQQQIRKNFAYSVSSIFGNSFKEFVERHLLHIATAAHSIGSAGHADPSLLSAIHHLRQEDEARRKRNVQLLLRRVATNIRTRILSQKLACNGNAFHLYIMFLYDRWRAQHEKARVAIKADAENKKKRLLNLVANSEGGNGRSKSKMSSTFLPSISKIYSRSLGPSSVHFEKVNLPNDNSTANK